MISGRLGAVYGHQFITVVGLTVLTVFTLITGFCTTFETFITMRAMSGLGGGLLMPNAVAMITTMVPPGRSRNIIMGFFAMAAPVGGVTGGIVAGLFTQYTRWMFMFIAL